MRTAQTIEQNKSLRTAEGSGNQKPRYPRGQHPNSRKNLELTKYPKGVSGNPGGRPKDLASHICRNIFEQNEEAIYHGLGGKLLNGDAYAFSVAADRGYGKLKQGVIHAGNEDGGPIETSIKVEFVKA